jgi:hypothetical protein
MAAGWLCAAGVWAQTGDTASRPEQPQAAASPSTQASAPPALSDVKQARGPIDRKMVQRIFEQICRAGIKHPKIVMQQAILETGWFRSPFLMTRHNLFGFRKVRYLEFKTPEESIRFYKNWQDKNYLNPDQNYFEFLSEIKYGSPDYPQHVARINWNQDCSAHK